VFGVSFTEIAVVVVVTLIVVGPQRLPSMLRSAGEWIRKLRNMTTEMREQTGIDDLLRSEGLEGGLSELRSIMRGEILTGPRAPAHYEDGWSPSEEGEIDRFREYPPEGVDAAGALPDDLLAPVGHHTPGPGAARESEPAP
jgi:sec-independent protein translocase protein TatB